MKHAIIGLAFQWASLMPADDALAAALMCTGAMAIGYGLSRFISERFSGRS